MIIVAGLLLEHYTGVQINSMVYCFLALYDLVIIDRINNDVVTRLIKKVKK